MIISERRTRYGDYSMGWLKGEQRDATGISASAL